jgi:uncharacterized membrane protein YgdD (TMEM256/DUF423 family)
MHPTNLNARFKTINETLSLLNPALCNRQRSATASTRSMKILKPALLAIIAVILNFAFWIHLNTRVENVFRENGPMENFQAVCLFLAVVFSVLGIGRSTDRAGKILFAGIALFCASILVLEVDVRNVNAPWLNKVMNGRIRDAWLGTFWLVALYFVFKSFGPVWRRFVAWLRSAAGVLMTLAGPFWIISALIDKSLLGRKDLFPEELMEVNATLLMIWSAFLAWRALSSKPAETRETSRPATKST